MIAALRVQLDCRSQRGDRRGRRALYRGGRSSRHTCGDCDYQQPAPELPDHRAAAWDGSLVCESTTAMMAMGSCGDCITTLSSLANGRLGSAAA